MAEETLTPQRLREFIDNLLDDLKTGRITPEAALVAGQQYEYLRNTFIEHDDIIAGSFSDENKFKSTITEIFEDSLVRVRRELPQFQTETPTQALSPDDIVMRANAFRVAREDAASAALSQQTRVAILKNNFVDRLVKNWITQTRSSIDKERQQTIANEIREKLEKAPLGAMSLTEVSGLIQKTIVGSQTEKGAAALVQESVAPTQKEFVEAIKRLEGLRAIPKALVSKSGFSHPDWFTSIAIQTGSIARADVLTRQAEAITPSSLQEKEAPTINVFFRAFASTSSQKVFAAAADALLGQLSPFARQEVVRATFSRALNGVISKTDELTQRLGQEFVQSDLFKMVMDNTREGLAGRAGDKAGGLGGALDDVVGSILRGPATVLLIGTPKETILSYFELLAAEAGLPENRKILFPKHAPPTPHAALQGATMTLATKMPSWQLYIVLLSAGTTPPSPPSLGGPGQPFLGAPSVAAPLGAAGGVFSSLGQALSGAAAGLAGGLLTTLFGGGLGALFRRRRGSQDPVPLLDDAPKLLALIVVAAVVVLFIFPSFLNAPFINNVAKKGALFVASQEIQAGGPYTETFPPYAGPFPGGPTAITSCAVDFKHQTQTPFDPGGIGTHKNTCAYDFDAPQHTPVRAAHGGYVAAVRFDIPDNKKIEGSYGNYVLIAGKTEGGQTFYSRYAHLAQSQPAILAVGKPISVDTIIGEVDNTGNTTGPHLHLEFLDENQGYVTKTQCSSVFSLPTRCTQ